MIHVFYRSQFNTESFNLRITKQIPGWLRATEKKSRTICLMFQTNFMTNINNVQ